MPQAGRLVLGAAAPSSSAAAIVVVDGSSDGIREATGTSRDIDVSGEVSVTRTKDAEHFVVSSGTLPTTTTTTSTTTTVATIGGGGSARVGVGGVREPSMADGGLHMESLLRGINSQLNINLDGDPTAAVAKDFNVDRGNPDGRQHHANSSAAGGGGGGDGGRQQANNGTNTTPSSTLLWGSHSSSSSASPTWGIIGETGTNFSSVSSSLGGSGSGSGSGGASGGGSGGGGSRSASVGSGLNHLLVQPNNATPPPPPGTSGGGGAFVNSDGVFSNSTIVGAGGSGSGSSGIPSLASISSSSASSSVNNNAPRGAKFSNAWMPHGVSSGGRDTIGISHVAIRQGTHPNQQQHQQGHQRGRNHHAQAHAMENNDNSYRMPQHTSQYQQEPQHRRQQQRAPHHEHQQQPTSNLRFSNAEGGHYDERQLLYAAHQSPQVPMQVYGMPYPQGQPTDWMEQQQQQQQQLYQEEMMYNQSALYSVQGDGGALEYDGHPSLVGYSSATGGRLLNNNGDHQGCFAEVHLAKEDFNNAIPSESLSYADLSRTRDGGNRNVGRSSGGGGHGRHQHQHHPVRNSSPRMSRKVHPMPTPPPSGGKGGLNIGGHHHQSQQQYPQQYTSPLPPMQKQQQQLQYIKGQLPPPRQRQQQLQEQKRDAELLKVQSLHNPAMGRIGATADTFSSMNYYRHQVQGPSPPQDQFDTSSAAMMAVGISEQDQGRMLQMTNVAVANSNGGGGVIIQNYCGVSAPMGGQLAVEGDVVATTPGHAVGLHHCASDPSLSTIGVDGTALAAAAAHNRLYHRSESSSPVNGGNKSVSGGRYAIGGIEAPGMSDPQGNNNVTVKLVSSRQQQQLTTVLTSPTPQQQQQRLQQQQPHPPLSQLVGNIRRLSRDQVGCRLLQHSLQEEGSEAATAILNELLPNLGDLMMDPFGNYLFQKLLDCLSTEEERVLLVRSVSPKLVAAALNLHGTRSVQKMVDVASSDEEAALGYRLAALVSGALQPAAARLCIDSHGNHVIQRILLGFPPRHAEFVFRCVARNVSEVARHRHGCCVIQRCLDAGLREMEEAAAAAAALPSEARDSIDEGGQQAQGDEGLGRENPMVKARTNLINKICEGALELMQDAYGNYVVQYVLDVCVDAPNYASIVNSICRVTLHRVSKLSIQKFSSNVIEKCLERCSEQMRELLLKELMHPRTIAAVMQDPFGNYVVQRALSVATHAQAVRLVESMKPHLVVNVRNTAGGRRIMEKIVKRFPNFNLDGDGALIMNGSGCGVGSMGGVGGAEAQRKVSSSNYMETKGKNQGMER